MINVILMVLSLGSSVANGDTVTLHYGKPGQSRIGDHKGYGYRLNHTRMATPAAPMVKALDIPAPPVMRALQW